MAGRRTTGSVERFGENHERLIEHFPLDEKREILYRETPTDEAAIDGEVLSTSLEAVAEAGRNAVDVGIATSDFPELADAMAANGKIVGDLPDYVPTDDDRILSKVSPKKRMLLNQYGFTERTINVIGASASISASLQVLG